MITNGTMKISWELAMANTTRFSYLAKDEDGNEERRGGQLRKAIIVVTFVSPTGSIDKVSFAKTSRSRNFRDSRLSTMQSEDDVRAELTRWLGSYQAERALSALQV